MCSHSRRKEQAGIVFVSLFFYLTCIDSQKILLTVTHLTLNKSKVDFIHLEENFWTRRQHTLVMALASAINSSFGHLLNITWK